jgi:carbonic anhydrase
MAAIDALLDRNQRFAAGRTYEHGPIYPNAGVCVVTCLDQRTDPANFLGLKLGDAAVIRNAGGRVNRAVIDDLSFVTYLFETVIKPEGQLFEVAIIHHTKCGTRFLADAEFRHHFAARVGGDEAMLQAEAVSDPHQTVIHDVALLRASTVVSKRITVSGHVYDVDTGVVTTVLAAASMQTV